jgi:DNA-binding NtrC family response regulator
MQPLKVLILDDEPIVGKRLGPALRKHGLDVEVFEDPNQAIARIGEIEFDIVVSDVRMEAMDGLKVLETVISKSARTKVIIITGYATVEVAREALVKGAFDFIAKPFKPNDLRLIINKAAKALGHPGIGQLDTAAYE